MKFLFFSGHAHLALDPNAGEASGGAELQVALLSKELVQRGHDTTIIATDTGQEDAVFWEGIKVCVARRFDSSSFWKSALAIPSVLRIIVEEKPDVVVVYGWTAWLYLLAQWSKVCRYRLVYVCALDSEIEGTFSYTHRFWGWLFKRGMRLCHVRFGITEHQKQLFHQQGMSCFLTRLLLQQAPAVTSSIIEKPIDLLWVARCNQVKQPLQFLELAKRFPHVRCQMICSNQDQELWKEVKDQVQHLDNIEFLEVVPYRDIQLYFNRAKIFVNTSLEEGVPNTFIHAALGHTAIASLRVDPDQMFDHFEAGFCAQDNRGYFFERIQKLLHQPDLLSHAQSEAARFVSTWHNNKKNMDSFLQGVEQ
ncbi:MAG: glycosyltransferase family 4 protein [Verrucomicrobia bacterium]|nr:MAG: glycosyltransferase family 4 protein [Verrucomicrobiota bacterium]